VEPGLRLVYIVLASEEGLHAPCDTLVGQTGQDMLCLLALAFQVNVVKRLVCFDEVSQMNLLAFDKKRLRRDTVTSEASRSYAVPRPGRLRGSEGEVALWGWTKWYVGGSRAWCNVRMLNASSERVDSFPIRAALHSTRRHVIIGSPCQARGLTDRLETRLIDGLVTRLEDWLKSRLDGGLESRLDGGLKQWPKATRRRSPISVHRVVEPQAIFLSPRSTNTFDEPVQLALHVGFDGQSEVCEDKLSDDLGFQLSEALVMGLARDGAFLVGFLIHAGVGCFYGNKVSNHFEQRWRLRGTGNAKREPTGIDHLAKWSELSYRD
jgi:hypothetical protein